MAKWIYGTTSYGTDRARFIQEETHHLKKIEAFLEDCDGDFVAWSVTEAGRVVEHGQVAYDTEAKNWEIAQKRAEYVICYGSKRFQQVRLEELQKHYAKA